MTEEPDILREQIRETQESLASKLSILEDKVVSTVSDTTDSVTETVENVTEKVAETVETVKDTVEETIESVKRTFDLEYQVRQHPWLMMGGSCAAGFLAGRLLSGAARSGEEISTQAAGATTPRASSFNPPEATRRTNGSARPEREGLLTRLDHRCHDELEQVKGLAVGVLVGLARDWVTQNLPKNLAPQIREVIDNLTVKGGGTPIQSPVLESLSSLYGGRKEAPRSHL